MTELQPDERLPLPPALTTERLTLRPMRLADAPALQRLFDDWEVVKHLNAHVPWPYPDDGAETHIRTSLEKRDRYYWTLTFRSAEDEPLGLISIRPDLGDEGEQRGFWLGRPYWGRGLMTEAAERVTRHAFVDLGWPHLWLGNAEANTASHRVKEKQGARIMDRVPIRTVSGDAIKVVWLLPRSDWLARHPEIAPEGCASAPTPERFPERLRMPETPMLESERLILRRIRESDAPAIQRDFPHWEVVRHLNAHVPWPYPADGAATNMIESMRAYAAREKCFWAITLKGGDDEMIGRIDLWADDGLSREQRGFWLARAHWGRGLMTEAAERVTEYAFVELGWPHLWLCNAEDNAASHRIKQRQGATLIDRTPARYVSGEGVRVTWLLRRDAWLARRGVGAPAKGSGGAA